MINVDQLCDIGLSTKEKGDMITMDEIKNNEVIICGKLASDFAYSHTVCEKNYYTADLIVTRFSKRFDIIPLVISERLVNIHEDYRGRRAKIIGQFQSHNLQMRNKTHLKLSVFVEDIHFENGLSELVDSNDIILDGFICKQPEFRITPLGREIVDVMLAVNRPYGNKSDYIPCIAWEREARYISQFDVGTQISVKGRIQSREYTKKLSQTECEKRIAYEVSISRVEKKRKSA